VLVADAAKAERVLDWRPQRDLDEIVRTAVAWHRKSGR
jgi:UDP-glucose 4-epimerase